MSTTTSLTLCELAAIEAEYFEALQMCSYKDYLMTQHWGRVRARCIAFYEGRCAVCCSMDQVEVHHRTYARRGHERPTDVIALCRECHHWFHENGGLTATYEGAP